MVVLRRMARPLLAAAFVVDGTDTLLHPEPRVKAADSLVRRGRQVLPDQVGGRLTADPATVVRINATTQVAGGVLLALGKAPRFAALMLAATVIPSTVTEQDFWSEPDPDKRAAKRAAFLKDVSLLGGLMIAGADTAGKPSLGWRGRRAAEHAAAAMSAVLPIGTSDSAVGETLRRHARDAALQARAFAETAAAKGSELADAAKAHGPGWAEFAKQRGAELAETAKIAGPVQTPA
ncbi:DoxX family protein [Nocardia sp. NPDC052566]|uniref:DoxX family protein n=1 Tax=Nocardia sp. NPDC052566 TaxID=3364330 RepID=UPI0037C752C9